MAVQRRHEDARQIQARMEEEAKKIFQKHTGQRMNRMGGADPLVYMLLGAAASELEKINLDVKGSWARMLERLAHLLIPEVHTGPKPAHAIAHARAEEEASLTDSTQQLLMPDHRGNEMFLSPTGTFRLVNGDVRCMVYDNTLYELEDSMFKTALMSTLPRENLSPFVVWVGLELPEGEIDFDQIQFFWDWNQELLGISPQEFLLSTTWEHQGNLIPKNLGISQFQTEEGQSSTYSIVDEFHLARKIEGEVTQLYQNRFVQLQTPSGMSLRREILPPELEKAFSPSDVANLTDQLVWVKVTFSESSFADKQAQRGNQSQAAHASLAKNILEQAVCLINCFPVSNRKFYDKKSFKLSQHVNLFQLDCEGFFLGIEGVISSRFRHEYLELPFIHIFDNKKTQVRSYSIRKTGVSRFDERNAKEILQNLIRFMREENFIFSGLGRGVVSNNIKMIEKGLNDLEVKLKEFNTAEQAEPGVYIGFPAGDRENVIVEYWSTEGFKGNNIPSGSLLDLYGSLPFQDGSTRLVTESQGGRDPHSDMNRLYEFKSALITRNRVVTEADMEAICFDELGPSLHKVEIKPGIMIGNGPKEGLLRTLDVCLHPSKTNHDLNWNFAKQKIETQLNAQSATLLPIRVQVIQN